MAADGLSLSIESRHFVIYSVNSLASFADLLGGELYSSSYYAAIRSSHSSWIMNKPEHFHIICLKIVESFGWYRVMYIG